jgi:hypothetical protein
MIDYHPDHRQAGALAGLSPSERLLERRLSDAGEIPGPD